MPWSNQQGGGWRGGSGGPWGSPPSGGSTPPDLEELLRRSQDRLKSVLPGGGFGGRGAALIGLALLGVWLFSGFYRVNADEVGIVTRFGKYVYQTEPGLQYHWPYPIETALTPKVTERRRTDVGLRVSDDVRRTVNIREVQEESLMLTGDENIVDVNFSVFWLIKPGEAPAYLFNIQNPEGTVKAVAESAMREVIGHSNIQPILTQARQNTETAVQELMQRTLDDYGAGIQITQVQLQKVDPPAQVIEAFRDVQAARADQERLQNEARTYANRIVPEARGQASQIIQAAQAYRERTVAEARGQSERFLKVYEEYRKAPDVTRQRIFLETMERVLGDMDKVIIDNQISGAGGVVPYLPLDQLGRPPAPARPQQQQGSPAR
jgi:modulator of FtsH protease HflK